MKSFEYGDGEIGKKEIMYAVPSMVIGIGILSLPRLLANATNFYDGAIALLIGGALAILFTWIAANLSSRFPKKSFFFFCSFTCPKAYCLYFQRMAHHSFHIFCCIRNTSNR